MTDTYTTHANSHFMLLLVPKGKLAILQMVVLGMMDISFLFFFLTYLSSGCSEPLQSDGIG